jgi:methionyl-tRNA formyltransferase
MQIGSELVVRTVAGLVAGTLAPIPQAQAGSASLRTAPKLRPEHLLLDPRSSVKEVHDLVRGMSPVPAVRCLLQWGDRAPMPFKVLQSRIIEHPGERAAGHVLFDHGRMLLACADGWLELLEVQAEGKRRMPAADFVRGLRDTDEAWIRKAEV